MAHPTKRNEGRSVTYLGSCYICGERVTNVRDSYYEITAWVSGQGGKSSKGAKQTGRSVHKTCYDYDPQQKML